MKILRDILTGVDNFTYDIGRFFCFCSHWVYFAMSFLSYFSGHPWDPMTFAAGIAAINVAFGIHMSLKKDTEPKP